MCQPTVRVNVDHSHLEHFSSLEEIAAAKGEFLMKAKPGDICILNADDPLVMSIPVLVGVKKVSLPLHHLNLVWLIQLVHGKHNANHMVYFGQKMGCDIRLLLAEVADGGCAVRVILERWQILHLGGRAADMTGSCWTRSPPTCSLATTRMGTVEEGEMPLLLTLLSMKKHLLYLL